MYFSSVDKGEWVFSKVGKAVRVYLSVHLYTKKAAMHEQVATQNQWGSHSSLPPPLPQNWLQGDGEASESRW